MIEVRGLAKRFGRRMVLRGLDFDVGSGEIVALLGQNGAGKTTLLRILAMLAKASAGRASLVGMDIVDGDSQVRAQVGFLAHQSLLYADLSAEQNLGFFADLYGIESSEQRVLEVLESVGLGARRRDPVRIFSRGMKQRLAFGRAILHQPKVLLLDEAHTGLDQKAIRTINKLLRELAEKGSTILMASHDLDIVSDLADRVLILSSGKISVTLKGKEIQGQRLAQRYREITEEKSR